MQVDLPRHPHRPQSTQGWSCKLAGSRVYSSKFKHSNVNGPFDQPHMSFGYGQQFASMVMRFIEYLLLSR